MTSLRSRTFLTHRPRWRLQASLIDLCVEEEDAELSPLSSGGQVRSRRAMAIQQKRMALVGPGLAVCNVVLAVAAQAQDVSFEEARNFAVRDGRISVA